MVVTMWSMYRISYLSSRSIDRLFIRLICQKDNKLFISLSSNSWVPFLIKGIFFRCFVKSVIWDIDSKFTTDMNPISPKASFLEIQYVFFSSSTFFSARILKADEFICDLIIYFKVPKLANWDFVLLFI